MPVFSSTKEIENLAEFSVPPERGNPLKRKIFSLWSFIFIELRIYTLFESYCIVCVPAFIFGLLLSDPAGRICGSASFFLKISSKCFSMDFFCCFSAQTTTTHNVWQLFWMWRRRRKKDGRILLKLMQKWVGNTDSRMRMVSEKYEQEWIRLAIVAKRKTTGWSGIFTRQLSGFFFFFSLLSLSAIEITECVCTCRLHASLVVVACILSPPNSRGFPSIRPAFTKLERDQTTQHNNKNIIKCSAIVFLVLCGGMCRAYANVSPNHTIQT